MRNFGKLALAAALALGVSAPSVAAPWNGGKGLDEKIARLDQRVKDAAGASTISEAQAGSLSKSVSEVQAMHTKFSKGGISAEEQSVLEDRIAKVKQQVDGLLGKDK